MEAKYIINNFFCVLCHRDPSRSFLYDGNIFLCARCTGMYAGFFITSVIMFYYSWRHKTSIFFTERLMFFSLLLMAVVPLEILINNYIATGSSNHLRMFTGLLLGQGIAMPSVAAWQHLYNNGNPIKISTKFLSIYIWVTAYSFLFYLLADKAGLLALIFSFGGISAAFFILNANVIFLFLGLVNKINLTKNRWAKLLLTVAIIFFEVVAIAYVKGIRIS